MYQVILVAHQAIVPRVPGNWTQSLPSMQGGKSPRYNPNGARRSQDHHHPEAKLEMEWEYSHICGISSGLTVKLSGVVRQTYSIRVGMSVSSGLVIQVSYKRDRVSYNHIQNFHKRCIEYFACSSQSLPSDSNHRCMTFFPEDFR